jgi:hypothetical protein
MVYPRVFNIALGRTGQLATLPAANDALIAVPIELTGVVSEATMVDYDDLAAILAGASNEQTTMGRKTLTGVVVATDDTGDLKTLDFDDIVWTGATGNDTALLVFCYDPDTTGGTDADLIPLVVDTFATDPAGADITYQTNAAGLWDSSDVNG